ncbi:MAG: DUF5606 domain-containing protein [Flavipsychrobacter sp.]|nr:DUF5606 domain-containing protein [Flavipsychrobacter sp.]
MEYREIVAVTGLPGLFQLLSTKSDGAIVKSLADRSTRFISARLHNVTPLESIEVYTIAENVRLHHVFKKMVEHESTIPVIDPKTDDKGIRNYFKTIFPEFDEVRVYVSDMKKMLKWYDLLKANDLLVFKEEEPEAEEAQDPSTEAKTETAKAEPAEVVAEEEKPAAKPKKAKKAVVETDAAEGEQAKPKKTAKKKKTEE